MLELRLSTKEDEGLPRIDFSQANELFTCPYKGNIRYSLNKILGEKSKSLQLGSLAHQCFAAIRLWWLYHMQKLQDEKYTNLIKSKCASNEIPDVTLIKEETPLISLSMVIHNIIAESKYEDDPNDKKRTKENLSISMYEYAKEFVELMNTEEIWYSDDKIGVEVPFEIVVNNDFVFIGKIDGIHKTNGGNVLPVENKTSSLINEAWLNQWELSNQIQGYCIACSFYTNLKIDVARIMGLQIPIGKSNPYQTSVIHKNDASLLDWFKWIEHCVTLKTKYVDKCIHNRSACYNYFRMCDYAHICSARNDDERQALIGELTDDTWNPTSEDI